MIRFLIGHFVPDSENTGSAAVRTRYSLLAGVLGILCNLILFLAKLTIGTMLGSIAVTSDAFNNLSDMGSSVISAVSAKLAGQRPDNEHPFGHGRLEYLASLAVSGIILFVAVELFRSSFDKLLHPEAVTFRPVPMLLLVLSVLVKLWMWSYNRYIGRKIRSQVLLAASADSINDVLATGAVILATAIGCFLPASVPVDGAMGIVVSVLIFRTGLSIAKETIDLLLGHSPDKETVEALEKMILSGEAVVGVHDLIVHDYGPGRQFCSAHAEIPDTADIVEAHECIDALEQKIFRELGIVAVIHTDPVTVGNEKVDALHAMVSEILASVEPAYKMHDFRITDGESHINIIFDMAVPMAEKPDDTVRKTAEITRAIKEKDAKYAAVIKIDRYTE